MDVCLAACWSAFLTVCVCVSVCMYVCIPLSVAHCLLAWLPVFLFIYICYDILVRVLACLPLRLPCVRLLISAPDCPLICLPCFCLVDCWNALRKIWVCLHVCLPVCLPCWRAFAFYLIACFCLIECLHMCPCLLRQILMLTHLCYRCMSIPLPVLVFAVLPRYYLLD